MSVLTEADALVSGDRQDTYGPPSEDFGRTAQLWSAVLGTPVTAAQVGLCMICVKLSRECHVHKRDNLVDIAGYAKTVQLVHEDAPKRPNRAQMLEQIRREARLRVPEEDGR